ASRASQQAGTGSPPAASRPAQPRTPAIERTQDWGDAPSTSDFIGRVHELATIRDWAMRDRCRLIGILGMGGIGQTSVAAKATLDLAQSFERVYWRSLRNRPAATEWMAGAIGFLSGQRLLAPEGGANQVMALLSLLREQSCLLVLDNFETLLEP